MRRLHLSNIPLPQIRRHHRPREAESRIRTEFVRRLDLLKGPEVQLVNTHDHSSPSLDFNFIEDNMRRKGVHKTDPGTITGCSQCRPHMGRHIGCEYSKKCDCLEYAEVDLARLSDEEKVLYDRIQSEMAEQGWSSLSTMGMPKRFPYLSTDKKNNGCLQTSYLRSRHAIYECNANCACGPNCKNRKVQHGRDVKLEIFRTGDERGWGLRCKQNLLKGQFIDCYRGEIITDAEATRREERGGKNKSSYLYSLDKFAESEQLDAESLYVIDGEFFGGPTRFINHSCEPNCRQYAVSLNKNDPLIYEIAFFAIRDIPPGQELVFDYLDKDEKDEDETVPGSVERPTEEAIRCLCGTKRCRKWLWT